MSAKKKFSRAFPSKFIHFAIPLFLLIISCDVSSEDSSPSALQQKKQQELEQAIVFVESNLSSLGDVGYQQWTPTTAAQQVVEMTNASQTLLPEEEIQYQEAGISPTSIPHLLNENPTQPWSIVLRPNEEQQTVTVEGYGTDLQEPLVTSEFPCCL